MSQIDELPSSRREEQVLEAVRRGLVRPVCWAPIVLEHGGHKLTISVSSDALRLSDGTRLVVTQPTAQLIADLMGASLVTRKISDHIWDAATVRAGPMPGTPDERMAHWSRVQEHSRRVDGQVAGKSGIASTVGKDWILTNAARFVAGERSAIYGWHRRNGLPIQSVSTVHVRSFCDYSQTLRLVKLDCVLDGKPADLRDVMQSKSLCHLVSDEGPLRVVRVPGVEGEASRTVEPPELSRAERMVLWMREHLGHTETPVGSNRSPLIDEWLSHCVRDLDGDGELDSMPLRGTEWCAATVCAAERETRHAGEAEPHPCFASGIELERWAREGRRGCRWVSAAMLLGGLDTMRPGDVAILQRGTGWTRHVCLVVEAHTAGVYRTIGGNEAHAVRLTDRSISDPALLGVLRYPDPHYERPAADEGGDWSSLWRRIARELSRWAIMLTALGCHLDTDTGPDVPTGGRGGAPEASQAPTPATPSPTTGTAPEAALCAPMGDPPIPVECGPVMPWEPVM